MPQQVLMVADRLNLRQVTSAQDILHPHWVIDSTATSKAALLQQL